MNKEEEFKELFLAEAQENQQELDKLFTELEKNHTSKKAIEAIFRITHTLKANAAGMGFGDIAAMAHTLEDIFSEIKLNRITVTSELFNDLFRANDLLGEMIGNIGKAGGEKVKYRGIKTKLEVLLKQTKSSVAAPSEKTARPENEPQRGDSTNYHFEKPIDAAEVTQSTDSNDLLHAQSLDSPLADNPLLVALPLDVRPVHRVGSVQDTDTLVPEPEEKEAESKITFSDNIHIPVRKLDELMTLVGELMIERDRVIAMSVESGRKANEYARLQRITSELQYSVMDVRLVQVAVLFNKFHRIVRDVATLESKQVNLVVEGAENEIDRSVLQTISDSLIHLVRNSVSHGIETEAERVKANKSIVGTVRLSARSEKEEVIIDVSDDGKGINPTLIRRKALERGLITAQESNLLNEDEVVQLIFEPGFSSAEQVTAVSGRGVGMDVVKRSMDSIGGKINVQSVVGRGTTISLTLPASMAVKNALLFELGTGEFAIPLTYTEAVISLYKKDIHKVGGSLIAKHLNKNISIVFLQDLFNLGNAKSAPKEGTFHQSFNKAPDDEKLPVIIVSYNNREAGFVVDRLLQQKEIVEKPLGQLFEEVKFISGATILGNGNVCLVLDAPSMMSFLFKNSKLSK